MKPIALQLYSAREQAKQDLPATLAKVAEIGYAGIEFAGLYGHDPKDVRKMLDDLGLVTCSAHTQLPTPETAAETIDTAKVLGYDLIVVSSMAKEDFQTPENIARAGAELEKAADMLRPHGLSLGYHNHSHEMIEVGGRYALEGLYEAAPSISTQIDTYWASNFGKVDVPAFVRKWSSRAATLHIKDGPLVQGEPHMAVGAGKMDVPAVIAAADETVLKWLIVELDSVAGDMMAAIAQSCRYLVDNGLAASRH